MTDAFLTETTLSIIFNFVFKRVYMVLSGEEASLKWAQMS